jgi:hypothetical protein
VNAAVVSGVVVLTLSAFLVSLSRFKGMSTQPRLSIDFFNSILASLSISKGNSMQHKNVMLSVVVVPVAVE